MTSEEAMKDKSLDWRNSLDLSRLIGIPHKDFLKWEKQTDNVMVGYTRNFREMTLFTGRESHYEDICDAFIIMTLIHFKRLDLIGVYDFKNTTLG